MKAKVAEKRENEDETGLLYDLHERLREILTSYNDTVKGRCAVCLEQFSANGEGCFTERVDLIRIDSCFHRFHLICVHRDWFMQRRPEKDDYGGTIEYKTPEIKRCPICRREVASAEITYIEKQFSLHPEVEDGGYSVV
jgi:rubrerythrin